MPASTPHRTTCVLDCPDACALEVTVDGDRIAAIGGVADHPDTAGFICSKVAGFAGRVDAAERLLHPLTRVGAKGEGRFERVSWDEALDLVVGRLAEVRRRSGGAAILPYHYGGSNGPVSDGALDELLFARLGASRLEKTICAAVTGAVARAMTGDMPGVAFPDYARAEAIVVWGANPRVSNIHLVPWLRRAKERGAFLALVDPRRTFSPRDLDLHLPVRPGADLPLALGLIAELEAIGGVDGAFLERWTRGAGRLLAAAREWPVERAAEVAGVEAAAVRRLARRWAEASPAVVRCGWGPERNRNGAGAIAAILALPVLTGKMGVAGGGYTLTSSGAWTLDAGRVLGVPRAERRPINMTRLARTLEGKGEEGPLDPPVEALFVFDANPMATVPEQERLERALRRDDLFTVVHEQVMTDTARMADVVLPATTFLEAWDLRAGYGSYTAGAVRPAIPPRGEAWSNARLFAALGRRLGFDDEAFGWSEEEIFRRLATALSGPEGPVDVERLAAGEHVRPDFPGDRPVQLGPVQLGPVESAPARPGSARPGKGGDGEEGRGAVRPRTPDGRIDLAPAALGDDLYRYRPPEREYPLAMISPASPRRINSTLGELAEKPLVATLHPGDAAERGIADGDRIRLFNDLGEVRCRARLDDAVRSGVVVLPKGAWRRTSDNGATATALTPDRVERVAGGACFNDARVEVERLEGATDVAGAAETADRARAS